MTPDDEPSPAPAQTEANPALPPRRRSRRGGRRRPRGRGTPESQPSVGEAPAANERAEGEPAPIETAVRSRVEPASSEPGIRRAIDQVTRIIEELKQVLSEMEEVLETCELAERQKIDDEREIESLQRALRQLHQGPSSAGRHR